MMRRADVLNLLWLVLIGTTIALLASGAGASWMVAFPTEWVLPIQAVFNSFMDWCVAVFGPSFRAFSTLMDIPMKAVRDFLHWMPWSATLVLVTYLAFAVSGIGLAVFTFVSVLYMAVIGYWDESMNSLALVAISVPLAVMIGFAIGTLAFYAPRVERIVQPTMDVLQTIPAFAYLLPILLLFGFGPVVGLIASILYAFPPTVRNTLLGLRQVPTQVVEAGLMSGATPGQLFWRVRVPTAQRQILLGVNQTTMAAFSMVIVASIIGGTADIGWEVLSTMRKAQFGESLLAGIVIALMAMVMDRITAAMAETEPKAPTGDETIWTQYSNWFIAGGLAVSVALLSRVMPWLAEYPGAWEVYPAHYLNEAINYVILQYAAAINMIKTGAFFYVMLPVKIGLTQTISPNSWGFVFTDTLKLGYGVLALGLTAWLIWKRGMNAGALVAFAATMIYFGLTRMPWPALVAMATLLSWQLGSWRLALGTFLGLVFLLLSGVWTQAVLSVYLCGIAVLFSFVIGSAIGILASEYEGVSAFMRPINDTLQTMPLFVILIPFVMLFKIGEFTALLAIIAYAIVPAIRYAEHGLRSVPRNVIEAATAVGCTRSQMLWRVRLPLAMPIMMLGLNQTIMYAIAMLVIAALVGTNELGQLVYIGLGNGDFGVGIVAGIGMAIIAMIADRMTQAWSRRRQIELGLTPV